MAQVCLLQPETALKALLCRNVGHYQCSSFATSGEYIVALNNSKSSLLILYEVACCACFSNNYLEYLSTAWTHLHFYVAN